MLNVCSDIASPCKTLIIKLSFLGRFIFRVLLFEKLSAGSKSALFALSTTRSQLQECHSCTQGLRGRLRDCLRELQLCLFKITGLKMGSAPLLSGLCSHSSDPGVQMVPLTPSHRPCVLSTAILRVADNHLLDSEN